MSDTLHVTDDLELYALDALPAPERARVAAHLADCPACREEARSLEEVAISLPNTLPQRAVPSQLRARILASAGADIAVPGHRGRASTSWLRPNWIAIAVLGAAVLLLGASNVLALRQLSSVTAERDQNADVVRRASLGGQNWYMSGRDKWAGSGGTLYAPGKPDVAAFVVFHDLRAIDASSVYALWLVDGDGHWVRAANFTPNGETAQAVILDAPVSGYTQCAVTVETQREGKRSGPVVMQSRIAPAAQ